MLLLLLYSVNFEDRRNKKRSSDCLSLSRHLKMVINDCGSNGLVCQQTEINQQNDVKLHIPPFSPWKSQVAFHWRCRGGFSISLWGQICFFHISAAPLILSPPCNPDKMSADTDSRLVAWRERPWATCWGKDVPLSPHRWGEKKAASPRSKRLRGFVSSTI